MLTKGRLAVIDATRRPSRAGPGGLIEICAHRLDTVRAQLPGSPRAGAPVCGQK